MPMPRTIQELHDSLENLWTEMQARIAAEQAAEREDEALNLTDAAHSLSSAQAILETTLRNQRKTRRPAAPASYDNLICMADVIAAREATYG